MEENKKIMCPSSRAKEGSEILGIRQDDGTIAILPQPLPIDKDVLANLQQSPVPAEQRFRFTNKCIENGCKQWNGKACGVADRVLEFLDEIPQSTTLPSCAIRPQCRWFLQSGSDACKICPYILTEITEEEIKNYQATMI